nr:unnamed protein product [Spirometra erinaceieuropaei]
MNVNVRSDVQPELVATGGKEVHAVEYAVVVKEQVVDGSRRWSRGGLHASAVEKVPIGSVGDAHPGALITVGVHPHGRASETEEGRREDAAQPYSSGHCERLGDCALVRDVRQRPTIELTYHVRESLGTSKPLHDSPQSSAIQHVEGFRQIHEGGVEGSSRLLAFLL